MVDLVREATWPTWESWSRRDVLIEVSASAIWEILKLGHEWGLKKRDWAPGHEVGGRWR
jgi:hypothetical protein